MIVRRTAILLRDSEPKNFNSSVKKSMRFVLLRQFLRNMFVEDFLHGQGDDDFVAALEERLDLL